MLEAIDECKSLNAAAKKMKMSYRASWGRLRASEERLGIKLVDRQAGEALQLTDDARTLLAEFRALEDELNNLISKTRKQLRHFDKDSRSADHSGDR